MVTALSAEYSSAPVAEVVKLAVHVVWAPAAVDDGTTVRPDTAFAVVIDTDAVAALVSAEVTTETDADPVVVVLVTALSATDSTLPAITPEPVLNEQVSVVPLVLKLPSLTMLLVVVSVTTQVSVLEDPSSVPDGSVTETLPSAAGIPPVAEVVNPTVQSALAPAAVDVEVAETLLTEFAGVSVTDAVAALVSEVVDTLVEVDPVEVGLVTSLRDTDTALPEAALYP